MRSKLRNIAKLVFLSSWIFLGYSAAAAQPKTPADIPLEMFAALPSFTNPQLSPSGSHLAFFAPMQGVQQLIVNNLAGNDPLRVPVPENQVVSKFQWLSNDILLYATSYSLKRRDQRVVTTQTRVHRLDMRSRQTRWLGAPDRSNFANTYGQHETILDTLPHDPENVLLALDQNRNGLYEVYKVNLTSGHKKIQEKERDYVHIWQTDSTSEVRLASGFRREKYVQYLKGPKGRWKNISDRNWVNNYSILGFKDDGKTAFAKGLTKHGMQGLYLLDLLSGNIIETLFANKNFDVDDVVTDPLSGQITGVTYRDDFTRIVYFDKKLTRVQYAIDKALPDAVNRIISHVPDKDWYLLKSYSDANPGEFYIFDRPNNHISFIAASRPQMDPSAMAPTQAVSIPVRDKEHIPGYLTTPSTTEEGPLPAIILPHGGPYGVRDTAAWDYEAQFYASRGYLVLKPNFRGSGGYGAAFSQTGRNQWGGRMQDDVTDATKWLINGGLADPDHICIVGSSYGGYAALMALVKEPDLYRCAVSVNGVTDLARLKSSDRRNTLGALSWIGSMQLDGVDDKMISPFAQASTIQSPVLLMSSVDDARIPFQLSVDLHEKLQGLGKSSRYVRIEKGTHNMVTSQARLTMLTATEKFLAKHLGK